MSTFSTHGGTQELARADVVEVTAAHTHPGYHQAFGNPAYAKEGVLSWWAATPSSCRAWTTRLRPCALAR